MTSYSEKTGVQRAPVDLANYNPLRRWCCYCWCCCCCCSARCWIYRQWEISAVEIASNVASGADASVHRRVAILYTIGHDRGVRRFVWTVPSAGSGTLSGRIWVILADTDRWFRRRWCCWRSSPGTVAAARRRTSYSAGRSASVRRTSRRTGPCSAPAGRSPSMPCRHPGRASRNCNEGWWLEWCFLTGINQASKLT